MNASEMQGELFRRPAEGAARRRDPETSKKAARTVRVGSLMEKVLNAIRCAPAGMTIEEISVQLDMSIVSVSPRMAPLTRRQFIKSSGHTRKNSSGHEATVYVAVKAVTQ